MTMISRTMTSLTLTAPASRSDWQIVAVSGVVFGRLIGTSRAATKRLRKLCSTTTKQNTFLNLSNDIWIAAMPHKGHSKLYHSTFIAILSSQASEGTFSSNSITCAVGRS